MKKLNSRSILFILLVAASIVSYIYLNTVSVENLQSTAEIEAVEADKELEGLDAQQKEIFLPDVRILKKAIDTGRRLIPASWSILLIC